MNDVAVISASGKKLMPTSRYRARHLLKSGKAKIHKYQPIFTIELTEREDGDTQPIEVKMDTGYQHIGVSVCSEKHEYLSRQYDLLPNEVEKHNDCRKYRRTRRNRKRYRKPRFNNRKGMICEDGFTPSIRNKRDRHIDILKAIAEVIPITKMTIEMGNFDTQVLKAVEEGNPLPEGTDYQYGERYGFSTLREAVFSRDKYTCQVCGKNGGIMSVHHIGFWKGDRTNRMANLLTVCEKCHTSKNHKEGGKLYGLEPKLKNFKGATFMTMVRWNMLKKIKELFTDIEINITYGAMTKLQRKDLTLEKSHVNDAYAMGDFHPKHKAHFERYKKLRRNNRVLERFYDAQYIDDRDNKNKKGSAIGCNRTKRNIPRNNPQNERPHRKEKVSNGRRSIRKQRYEIQPRTLLSTPYGVMYAKGVHNKGASVQLSNGKDISPKKTVILQHPGGWILIKDKKEESGGGNSSPPKSQI